MALEAAKRVFETHKFTIERLLSRIVYLVPEDCLVSSLTDLISSVHTNTADDTVACTGSDANTVHSSCTPSKLSSALVTDAGLAFTTSFATTILGGNIKLNITDKNATADTAEWTIAGGCSCLSRRALSRFRTRLSPPCVSDSSGVSRRIHCCAGGAGLWPGPFYRLCIHNKLHCRATSWLLI
jgi:hypothetical protein